MVNMRCVCAVGGLKASVRHIICFCNAQVGVGE